MLLDGFAHGGEAVGRLPDGRACFVAGGLPGERVRVRVTQQRRRWARAALEEVLEASPDRVAPPCPYYGHCGGCQLQHASPAAQARLKQRVVVEQLQRIGGIADPPVADVVRPAGGWPDAYRSWARFGVTPDGRLGLHAAGSADIVPIDRCLLLDGATQRLREAAGDRWDGVEEVEIRTGDGGVGVVHAHVGSDGLRDVPDGPFGLVLSAGATPSVLREPGTVRLTVAGETYRLSPGSFFQAGPAAAAALVRQVLAAAAPDPTDDVLDLYAGAGLFSVPLARTGARVVAVEAHPAAAADAVANLAGLDAEVWHGTVSEALAEAPTADVVVLDPPRAGAGTDTAAQIAALGPRTIVYVACDVAALARDAKALVAAGYTLRRAVPVDAFGHTAHIEVVAAFAPAAV